MIWVDGVGPVDDAEWAEVQDVISEVEGEQQEADLLAIMAEQEHLRAAGELRELQDAEDPGGRDGARLARAIARIGTDSYVAPPGTSGAADQARADMSQPGRVQGSHCCGPSGAFGYCLNSSHEQTCGSLSMSEIGQGLADAGVYREIAGRGVLDGTGLPVVTSGGTPATWADITEANSGQRTRTLAFEDGQPRRELARVGTENPYANLADAGLMQRARDAMNITTPQTGHERGAGLQTRTAVAQMAGWKSGRAPHADYSESTRERRERMHSPVQLQQHDEPAGGSLPTFRAR